MTSRLDRLFVLLESGQSVFLRRSAAFQIGEVVKTHPSELEHLLERIKPLICSASWDTRIAASQTIESIVKHINNADLICLTDGISIAGSYLYSNLNDFYLSNLLISGAKLLSSHTQKYDLKYEHASNAANSNGSDVLHETIKNQRKLLNSKLGIDVGGAAKIDTSHIFSDNDLIDPNAFDATAFAHDTPSVKRKQSELESDRDANNCDVKPVISDNLSAFRNSENEASKKIKVEGGIAPQAPLDSNGGADITINKLTETLYEFVQWLFNKLFDPEWETRHGSATCLREIIKPIVNSILHNHNCIRTKSGLNWFEDCLVKLLSVIALDRFADYIGDEAVAPVRETCAQIIGIISGLFNYYNQKLRDLCTIVNTFLCQSVDTCWEVRHSGIMILKYVIAATMNVAVLNSAPAHANRPHGNHDLSHSNLTSLFELTFENILSCIRDKDDDVRQVASSSLEPVSAYLTQVLDNCQLEKLVLVLIDVLSDIDDLGTSCSTIMNLLSDLLTAAVAPGRILPTDPRSAAETCDESDALTKASRIRSIFFQLLSAQSIIPRLIPFLHHSSLVVKRTTLNTINKVILAISEDSIGNNFRFESIETDSNLTLLFRLLYQQAILLASESSFAFMQNAIQELWRTLCYRLSSSRLINVCFPFITTWLLLLMHPFTQPIDSVHLVSSNSSDAKCFSSQAAAPHKEFIGSNQIKFEDRSTRDLIQIKCRLLAARLLAILFNRIDVVEDIDATTREKPIHLIINFLSGQINLKSGLQRFCFGLLIIEWIQVANERGSSCCIELLKTQLGSKIVSCLDDENTIYFDEIALLFTRLQKECRNLLNNYGKLLNSHGLDLTAHTSLSVFTFENVNSLMQQIQQSYLNSYASAGAECKSAPSKMLHQELRLCLANLAELNEQTSQEQESLQMRSSFALASSAIRLGCYTERMNPLIRPLIDCIRFEANSDLQSIASKHLAILLSLCAARTPNPVPKIFKNLLGYLCNDPLHTPLLEKMTDSTTVPDKDFYDTNRYFGILSDQLGSKNKAGAEQANNSQKQCSKQQRAAVAAAAAAATANTTELSTAVAHSSVVAIATQLSKSDDSSQPNMKQQTEKRGAEYTFKSICEYYKDAVSTIIPELIHLPFQQLHAVNKLLHDAAAKADSEPTPSALSNDVSIVAFLNLKSSMCTFQELINYLCLLENILQCGHLSHSIVDQYVHALPSFIQLIRSPLAALRNMSARFLAALCKQRLVSAMAQMLEYIFASLDRDDLFARQGAIELVHCLFEQLEYAVIPFTVIFIIPVLKRMCDTDWHVRDTASQCFAFLVKLYPLAAASGCSPSASAAADADNPLEQIARANASICSMKLEQQDFLDQLMDNRKLRPYELPDDGSLINVKLRSYQQAGVNWLGFLNKFNLHGILCDDMGLGKTLQSICILAGDHSKKQRRDQCAQQRSGETKSPLSVPSLIICPTTLTNHWYHEIERFVSAACLRPFIYSGTVAEREYLRHLFFNTHAPLPHVAKLKSKHSIDKEFNKTKERPNVLIMSYETIRHDIAYISSQQWNYCILDEGHLIKSSKSKLSKAIKLIRAAHRVILTGTPIQNNVTELWCLFDFLIPGYLGTEKQFNAKYAKYITPQSTAFHRSLQQESSADTAASENKDIHQLSLIALETLHKQVLPFLLRRTKDEVLKDLPPKIIQDYYCEMSPLQVELYQDFAKSNSNDVIKHQLGYHDDNEDRADELTAEKQPEVANSSSEHVFQALQYLRKVVNHPSLVLKPEHPKWSKITADLKSKCSSIHDYKHSGKLVALRELLLECGIGVSSLSSGDEDFAGACAHSSDMENNIRVINQHRVLIFCQLKSMIDIIESELLKKLNNVSFLRLDGTIPPSDRYSIVSKFNSDPSIDILLLTTQIGGLGLNLTGADTVIFVEHDWNPQKDLQAMDRAHRIGQTKVVNVYRLITKRSIEEKIMSLQKFKLGIANSVVNIENSSLSSMDTQQLMNMLNKEDQEKNATGINSYQQVVDNINEVWDETQYENEYNLDNFLKSLYK